MLRESESEIVHFLNASGQTLIGRAKSCDIQLESTSISKQHAVITAERVDPKSLNASGNSSSSGIKSETIYWLEDLDSRNGTSTSNPKTGTWIVIPPKSRHRLQPGDLIKFGHASTTYVLMEEDDQEQKQDETFELGHEREPLNYQPEVFSNSIQVNRLSKEQPKPALGSSNRLQFSIEYPSDQIHDYPPISVQVGQSWKSNDFSTNSSHPVSKSKESLRNSNSSDHRPNLTSSLSSLHKSRENIPKGDLSLSDDYGVSKGQKGALELSPLDGESFVDDDEESHLPDYDDDSDLGGGSEDFDEIDKQDQLFFDSDSLAVMGVGFHRPPTRKSKTQSLPHTKNPRGSQIHPLRSSSPSNLHLKHGTRASGEKFDNFSQPPIPQYLNPAPPVHTMGTPPPPADHLTPQEVSEIQASRDGLADGVRVANKILGGVAPFDDWKRYASTILTRLSPSHFDHPVGSEERNPLSKSTPIDSKFKIMITSEVITAVKREKVQDPSQSSVTLLSKVKNNLVFLLEYEVHPPVADSGLGLDLGSSFPCELFNSVLSNCVQLFHDKILSNPLIMSLDRSVQSSLHSTPSPAHSLPLPATQPLSVIRYITKTILPKFQGLITFNENWNHSDTPILLDLKQIQQVNRYISSNLLNDIEQLLDCIIELKNNILKENIQLAKYIFASPSPSPSLQRTHSPTVSQEISRGEAVVRESRGILAAGNSLESKRLQKQPVDTSIESFLSGEFTADGELKIQSTSFPHLDSSKSKSFRSPRSSGEMNKSFHDEWEQNSSEEFPRRPLPQTLQKNNKSSTSRSAPDGEEQESVGEVAKVPIAEKKSLWKNTIQEAKKKQFLSSPSASQKLADPIAAPPPTSSKQSPLWSEEKQREFELKSKAILLIKRIHRKFNSKLRNYCFYHWKFFNSQQKNFEIFEMKWKNYETKHLEEIQKNEMKLSSHYKELLELKDQEIESLDQMIKAMKEKQQEERSGDEITKSIISENDEILFQKTKDLIKDKEQRILELEEENEEVKRLEMKKKNEIELRYLEELKEMQERFKFLEQDGKEERLRNDQKIFLLRCEMSNQKRSAFNVKLFFGKWKRIVEAMREKIKRKQMKERQLRRSLSRPSFLCVSFSLPSQIIETLGFQFNSSLCHQSILSLE